MMKAIFLDKNGTLTDDIPYHTGLRSITLCSGAGAALRLLARLDYRLFVVSNEDGIGPGTGRGAGPGIVPESAIEQVRDRVGDLLFREQVQLDGFYFCPHQPDGAAPAYTSSCTCRKPQPGMLLQAASEHAIDLGQSWMIGDALHDVEAGNRAGCRSLLVDNGNETDWRLGPYRVPASIVPDLYAAALVIANADGVRP